MPVVFSDHALLKIRQRKLSRRRVLETIAHPDFMRAGYNGREVLLKWFGKKNHMQVVVVREETCTVVVTAHWIAEP